MNDDTHLDASTLPPSPVGPGALEGVRVLDLATMMAAPWAGTYMADYGAEVVKAELPGRGDPVRQWGSQFNNSSLAWKGLARNKTLITLALNTTEGQELLLRMVPEFDVLIENFRPGVLERWGLSPERLHEANPRLVILRTSGYGQTGPYATKPGFGTLAEAFSGLSYITGSEDRPPVLSGYPLADGVAALAGAMSVLAALYWRDASGGTGQVIDNAIIEANYRLIDYVMLDYEKLGLVRSRAGNRLGDLAPRNTYQTRDGSWVAISGGTQGIVERLFTAMEQPELIKDPRFLTNALRLENVSALDDAISAWMIRHDVDEVLEVFETFGVAGAAVNNSAQIAAHPHFQARELLVQIDDEELGPTSTPHVHPRMSKTPGGVKRLGGPIGRDNESFYRDVVGLTEKEMADLREAGAI
ncbi:CaiB/BaiF CoA transferase family protein [Nocardioides marmotae]|uniref:CaiB/BaiF CoA transferase family protein n=1 Tax=Nocardioides marmotae TaxID=2663857 RepID=UPI0012B636E3|nr:CoA transferase [Nocardioides marmotae]MBC9732798.1 CoA transferase [Nocardioides marmotae]MTB83912.1 CoA transferase [Nocardioides marmotae]